MPCKELGWSRNSLQRLNSGTERFDHSRGCKFQSILEEEEMSVPHFEFVAGEGSQPVEENANAVDTPIVDDPPSVRFTWKIENFSKLTRKKLYSHIFFVGGYKCRVLMYPKGNNTDHLSMYLDVADSTTSPHGWSRNALFSLAVVNQIHSEFSLSKEGTRFTKENVLAIRRICIFKWTRLSLKCFWAWKHVSKYGRRDPFLNRVGILIWVKINGSYIWSFPNDITIQPHFSKPYPPSHSSVYWIHHRLLQRIHQTGY
uniref:Putative TRAF-like protein n=1 Tax=Helianthus annuus TaxID=4232 RepID=A0A251TS21_HELAN